MLLYMYVLRSRNTSGSGLSVLVRLELKSRLNLIHDHFVCSSYWRWLIFQNIAMMEGDSARMGDANSHNLSNSLLSSASINANANVERSSKRRKQSSDNESVRINLPKARKTSGKRPNARSGQDKES